MFSCLRHFNIILKPPVSAITLLAFLNIVLGFCFHGYFMKELQDHLGVIYTRLMLSVHKLSWPYYETRE